jgi:hypothetical protein
VFSDPMERSIISYASEDIIIFDSAFPGAYSELEYLAFQIDPGSYEVKTVTMKNDHTSWVMSTATSPG